ncbi:MAG: alpha/beta fold hydrolase [Luteolibacter sp.]
MTWKIPAALSVLLLANCSLLHLREESRLLTASGTIGVSVSVPPADRASTRVLAFLRKSGGTVMAGCQTPGKDGIALLLLRPENRYGIAAFTDRNGNRMLDPGEPAAFAENIAPVPLNERKAKAPMIRLTLSPWKPQPGQPSKIALPAEDPALGSALGVALGEVASLDDPRFTMEVGSTGLWKPQETLVEHGAGIYFVEPYDPGRIPVLFVSGIGGSPQDWRHFINHLDKRRYQAWFFCYPSGLHLDRTAEALAKSIDILRRRYQPREFNVVAHSMGGLVARGALLRCEKPATKFVSISTPWGGHKAAEGGLRHLRHPLPSWHDMVPGSAYQESLFTRSVPAEFYLIYGKKTKKSPWLSAENDGVVDVASELEPKAVKEARAVKMFPLDHEAILQSSDTLGQVERFLAN